MSEPRRWLDGDPDAPPEARELLRHAAPTRAIDKRALSVSAAIVAKLAAAPAAAAALPLGAQLFVSATVIAVAGAVAVQIALPAREPAAPQPHAHARTEATGPRGQTKRATDPRVPVAAVAPAVQVLPVVPPPAPPAAAAQAPAAGGIAPALQGGAMSVPRSSGRVAARVREPDARHLPAPPEPRAAPTPTPAIAVPSPAPELVPAEPAPDADPLAREVQLLDSARALLDDDPAAALQQADAHAERYPRGGLAAERELIAVDALQRLGRRADAEVRAQRLRARFPGSMYRARLDSLLAPRR